jgi:hypothetical protein
MEVVREATIHYSTSWLPVEFTSRGFPINRLVPDDVQRAIREKLFFAGMSARYSR